MVILDYGGVCTFTAAELIAQAEQGESPPPSTHAVRPEAEVVMAAASQAGLTTVILSNELDRAWVDQIPVLATADHIVVGSDNGIYKPDRRAFQRCLLLTNCSPDRGIVVDDQPDNVTVAASLGLHTVLFDPAWVEGSWRKVTQLIDQLATN